MLHMVFANLVHMLFMVSKSPTVLLVVFGFVAEAVGSLLIYPTLGGNSDCFLDISWMCTVEMII